MALPKLLSLFRQKPQEPAQDEFQIPTIAFDSNRVIASVRADIRSTLKAAGDIPKGKLPTINKAAIAAVESGGDLGMLQTAIMSSNIVGLTERRASEITIHIHSRATSLMDVERMVGNGIEEAAWSYSGAPRYVRTKAPSPEQLAIDAAHKAANGQRYRVRDGLTIGGKPTWPSREMGCKCSQKAVVAGFS